MITERENEEDERMVEDLLNHDKNIDFTPVAPNKIHVSDSKPSPFIPAIPPLKME